MTKTCEVCNEEFETLRPNAKRCKKPNVHAPQQRPARAYTAAAAIRR